MTRLLAAAVVLAAGCSSAPPRYEEPDRDRPPPEASGRSSVQKGGAFYKDDGPGDRVPPNLDAIADAVPREEPLHRAANRPYQVLGLSFVPLVSRQPFHQRGVASWYGRRYHGKKTSIGETYDMYAMTAAHPTLPLPSYARVTHAGNRKSVVVRVNDRGPFIGGRIIDLSYAAAYRLGFVQTGSAEVEVEAILAGAAAAPARTPSPAPATAVVAGDVYVQLGAFSARGNAESLRERVADNASQIVMIGNLWRVQVGPYRTQEDARAAAQRIESLLNLKALIVVR